MQWGRVNSSSEMNITFAISWKSDTSYAPVGAVTVNSGFTASVAFYQCTATSMVIKSTHWTSSTFCDYIYPAVWLAIGF